MLFSIFSPLGNITYAIGSSFNTTIAQANVVAIGATTASGTNAITLLNSVPADGDTLTISGAVYTFSGALANPAVENTVLIAA